jgi:CBS domain-containing protein
MAKRKASRQSGPSTPSGHDEPGADIPTLAVLPAASRAPLTVTRDATLRQAETKMLLNGYSQLPVMTGERTVHGLISWQSIGRAHVVGRAGKHVRDCMDSQVHILAAHMPLLSAVDEIIRYEVVLVQDSQNKIAGLVTTADLSMQLRDLTDAFLLIGNIERQLRRLIGTRFSVEVLRSFVSPHATRNVSGVSDLTLGETLRLLRAPDHWSKLGLKVDGAVVLERLEHVTTVRNAVMHFSDASKEFDLGDLRKTEQFLAALIPDTQPFREGGRLLQLPATPVTPPKR